MDPHLTVLFVSGFSWKNAREFQKNIYFCFIDYAKAFGCVDHNKLWKILKGMGIPDHLTCRLRNLYAGGRDSDGFGWGSVPVVLPGVATAAGNAPGARQGRG